MPPVATPRHPGILRQLLLPLEPAALVTTLVLAGVLWACFKVLPAGIALMAILLSWFFKYSFALLDQQASGSRRMPVLSIEMIMGTMGEFRWLVPLLLVAAAFFGTGAASFLLGMVISAFAATLLLVMLPAMLVIQGWTGRLAHSLHPRLWLQVAGIMRLDYALLVGCTAVLALASIGAPLMFDGVPRVLRFVLALYAWLALIALTGGALFRHRAALAAVLPLIVTKLRPRSAEELQREREAWLDDIYGPWRGGNRDGALGRIAARLEHSQDALGDLRWLLERASAWESPALANQVAMDLVSRLLGLQREGEALRIVKQRLAADPGFRPRAPDECRRLAELAGQWRDTDTAQRLFVARTPEQCQPD